MKNLFLKNINLHISQQRLEIEWRGQYLVVIEQKRLKFVTFFNILNIQNLIKKMKSAYICANIYSGCILVHFFIQAAYFFANFHTCWIFVQTFHLASYYFVAHFIQPAYLCKISFLLHICANLNLHIFLCNFSFKLSF